MSNNPSTAEKICRDDYDEKPDYETLSLKEKVELHILETFEETVNIPKCVWEYVMEADRHKYTVGCALRNDIDEIQNLAWICYALFDWVEAGE